MKFKYKNQVCFIATMHEKQNAIKNSFESILGCQVVQAKINTDLLGTFTGEIERRLSPFECVKEKCTRGLDAENGDLGVASEGSFKPHPLIPFVSVDHEILFFIDRKNGFELTLSKISLDTNFSGKAIFNLEELAVYAKQALFPSHGLIIRPNQPKNENLLFKGIQVYEDLMTSFKKCQEASIDNQVWVETDMRAHMNPTRMKVIAELGHEMAVRLATTCPSCEIPGWGVVKKLSGLPCKECGTPTQLVHSEVNRCCKCEYQEIVQIQTDMADPRDCPFCNP